MMMADGAGAIAGDSRVVEIDVTDVAYGGEAMGRVDGQVVFVPYTLPGERVRAELRTQKRDYGKADLVEVLRPAPDRVAPRCPLFGACGGCSWQHAAYATQLLLKRQVVVDQLRRIGGMAEAEDLVREPIGMIEPWGYRNHVRFTLGRKYGDVGYTYRESHRLLRVDLCHIAHPAINEVLSAIQRRCAGLRAHQIAVRYGCNTGDLVVIPALPMVPELPSGQAGLTDEILDRRFHVSPAAFFQVNTLREQRELPPQLEVPWLDRRGGLYSIADLLGLLVLDRLRPEPHHVVVDAYCGVGTFAALLAPRAREVIGIDESKAAIKDAVRNTSDLPNVRFVSARAEDGLAALTARVDGVVLDPSRVGCSPAVISALIERRAPRVVYVSCDPATLARDLRLLRQGGYRVEQVEPLDMFPQTYHIEMVTTLTWVGTLPGTPQR